MIIKKTKKSEEGEMKILDFISKDSIKLNMEARGKKESISELVDVLVQSGKIKKEARDAIIKAILEREELGSTGIGQGVAIPHAKTNLLSEIVGAVGISKKGIEFNTLDGEPAYIIFMLIAPIDSSGLHLKALARISHLLKDKFFRQALRDANKVDEVIKIIKEEDEY